MRTSVHTCRPSDDVLTALSLMTDRRVRRLPVVDDAGRLVGIVSLNDAVLPAGAGRNAVRPGAVLDAFKAVCAHPIPVPMSEGAAAEKTGASENSVSRAVGCSANRLLIATPCCGIRRACGEFGSPAAIAFVAAPEGPGHTRRSSPRQWGLAGRHQSLLLHSSSESLQRDVITRQGQTEFLDAVTDLVPVQSQHRPGACLISPAAAKRLD
jgi:hypothetical protein